MKVLCSSCDTHMKEENQIVCDFCQSSELIPELMEGD